LRVSMLTRDKVTATRTKRNAAAAETTTTF